MRRSFRIRLACERLRARRNPGTAIAASNAMIATTIMISTSVKPACFRFNLVNIILLLRWFTVCLCLSCDGRGFFQLRSHNSFPATPFMGEWQANESSDSITLRPVRRPKASAGDVRQNVVIAGWHCWNSVHRLTTVGTAQKALGGVVEGRIFLEVVGPISGPNHEIGGPIGFDGVLVDGGVDDSKVIKDSAGLGTFTCTEESGHGDRRQERDDRNHDHDFHEGEAPAAFIKFV